MPCRGPEWEWKPPTEEELIEINRKKQQEAKEYMNNTFFLLTQVLLLNGSRTVDEWNDLEEFNLYLADLATEKLCFILKGADENLKEKIKESKYAPYISAWWAEHKKLDKQRENETKSKEKEGDKMAK